MWQPYPIPNTGAQYGLGDMNATFFLSPRKPGKLIWGAGPAFALPTATNDILEQGKFSLGPSIVALTQADSPETGWDYLWIADGPAGSTSRVAPLNDIDHMTK